MGNAEYMGHSIMMSPGLHFLMIAFLVLVVNASPEPKPSPKPSPKSKPQFGFGGFGGFGGGMGGFGGGMGGFAGVLGSPFPGMGPFGIEGLPFPCTVGCCGKHCSGHEMLPFPCTKACCGDCGESMVFPL